MGWPMSPSALRDFARLIDDPDLSARVETVIAREEAKMAIAALAALAATPAAASGYCSTPAA
jgi:hypothetical protein